MEHNFKLGEKVEHIITGHQGYVVAIENALYRASKLKAKGKDGSQDADLCEWKKIEGKLEIEIPESQTPKLTLGAKVKCKLTGLSGHLTSVVFHLNGCLTYELLHKGYGANEGKFFNTEMMEAQLEVIDEPKEKPKKVSTGSNEMSKESKEVF